MGTYQSRHTRTYCYGSDWFGRSAGGPFLRMFNQEWDRANHNQICNLGGRPVQGVGGGSHPVPFFAFYPERNTSPTPARPLEVARLPLTQFQLLQPKRQFNRAKKPKRNCCFVNRHRDNHVIKRLPTKLSTQVPLIFFFYLLRFSLSTVKAPPLLLSPN